MVWTLSNANFILKDRVGATHGRDDGLEYCDCASSHETGFHVPVYGYRLKPLFVSGLHDRFAGSIRRLNIQNDETLI